MSCQHGDKSVDFCVVPALCLHPPPPTPSPTSLDKILAAMTIAAERNNKERFASIVEGLENHEAQQLQVWTHTAETSRRPSCPNAHHACSPPYPAPFGKAASSGTSTGDPEKPWHPPILLFVFTLILQKDSAVHWIKMGSSHHSQATVCLSRLLQRNLRLQDWILLLLFACFCRTAVMLPLQASKTAFATQFCSADCCCTKMSLF